ncbi:hypothetical protein EXIGLDRAFT_726892 [Exidia glandulosa HHB12029]|uniref:CCHC-type domain-containing protein n=1 Tax=Exidia glandulosa HHB12029 TaxID=1314781 RepID=A0A165DJA1_EXIGL|nr:hypothetical protein EXIGLDRAFT_726892 [Exidia glandulosa HHB12029]
MDELTLPYLWSKIHIEYRYLVDDCDTASDAWAKLKVHFDMPSMFSRIHAREEFYAVEHDISLPIDAYIHAVTEAKARLTALGVTISDDEFKDVLLMRLDPSFHAIRTNIVTQRTEPKLEEVKMLLRAAGNAQPSAKAGPQHGLAARGMRNSSRTPSSARTTPNPGRVDSRNFTWCDTTTDNCHRCSRSGHIAARCMLDMPQHVRDWIVANPYSPPPTRSNLAAEHAGLAFANFGRLDSDLDNANFDPSVLDISNTLRI